MLTDVPKITQPKSKGVSLILEHDLILIIPYCLLLHKALPNLENVFDLHTRPIRLIRNNVITLHFFLKGP